MSLDAADLRSLPVMMLAAAIASCNSLPDGRPDRLEAPMSTFPEEEGGYLIRTDFSNQSAWQSTLQAIVARYGIFEGTFHVVDDPAWSGATKQEIADRLGPGFDQSYVLVVDSVTLSHPDRPVLVVDFWERSLDEFRAIPAEVGAIQINLALANMDFQDFAGSADPDGIFRGFEEPAR